MEKDFVAYEYKTVSVKAKDQMRAADLYEAFGWEIVKTELSAGGVHAILSLKRDRKQKHKQELNKLERQAEETFQTIDGLERSKTSGASVFAYLFGIFATLVFGGGMCAVLLNGSGTALILGILFGVLGLALCGGNYVVYTKLVAKKTKEVLPVIDQAEEQLAVVLEKGNDLLGTDLL